MKYLSLIFLFIVGIFIYFWALGKVPNGLYIDEALPAYNAYSILRTGRDEYGKPFPIVFRFYGSYNPPFYTYLTVIPVYLFGLTVFSARFVSALAGVISVVIFYLLLEKSGLIKTKQVLFWGSLFYLASPWLLFYSRTGDEISLGFVLFSLGAFLLWLAVKNIRYLIFASLVLSLSTYASYFDRFLVPAFILIFLWIFRKEILMKKNKNHLISSLLLVIVTQIPNFLIIFTPAFFPKSNLVDNFSLNHLLGRYLAYFSPRSLFFDPDPDLQRSIPELSVFYFWMIIPFFVGLYRLWKQKENLFVRFLLIILFLAPIPGALTKDPFATHRAILLLLPVMIIISLGIDALVQKINSKVVFLAFVLLAFLSGLLLWRSYFVLLPSERASVWGYGVETLAKEIAKRPDESFVIEDSRTKPVYMNLAFFLKYQPSEFQKKTDQSIKNNYYTDTRFDGHYKFANLETRSINWERDIYVKQILVGDEFSISAVQAKEHFLTKVFEIRDPLDRIVFIGYETNPGLKCLYSMSKSVYCRINQ